MRIPDPGSPAVDLVPPPPSLVADLPTVGDPDRARLEWLANQSFTLINDLQALVAQQAKKIETLQLQISEQRTILERAHQREERLAREEIERTKAQLEANISERRSWREFVQTEAPKLFAVLTAVHSWLSLLFAVVSLIMLRKAGFLPEQIVAIVNAVADALREVW